MWDLSPAVKIQNINYIIIADNYLWWVIMNAQYCKKMLVNWICGFDQKPFYMKLMNRCENVVCVPCCKGKSATLDTLHFQDLVSWEVPSTTMRMLRIWMKYVRMRMTWLARHQHNRWWVIGGCPASIGRKEQVSCIPAKMRQITPAGATASSSSSSSHIPPPSTVPTTMTNIQRNISKTTTNQSGRLPQSKCVFQNKKGSMKRELANSPPPPHTKKRIKQTKCQRAGPCTYLSAIFTIPQINSQ